jgi:lysozyme
VVVDPRCPVEGLREDLIADEGIRLKPYLCPAGKTTIGVGRNLDDVGITEDEAMEMLENDIERVKAQLAKALPWLETKPPGVQRAIGNMTFQMGLGGVLKFKKMLAAIQARDYTAARREALDSAWAKQTPQRAKRVTDLFKED